VEDSFFKEISPICKGAKDFLKELESANNAMHKYCLVFFLLSGLEIKVLLLLFFS